MLEKLLGRLKQRQRQRAYKLKLLEITNSTDVCIKSGNMYITCDGKPISKIEEDKSVAYVLNEVNEIIRAKISYENIND